MEIAESLSRIRIAIDAALARAGEPDRSVTIVAVTKNQPAAVVETVAAAGLHDIGENRVQEALAKEPDVSARVRWHLIGHLQRNKAAQAASLFSVIHSVDSVRLVEALARTQAPLEIFLQINVSGEPSKFGARPEDARALWQAALITPMRVAGLMTMAPFEDDPERTRPVFRALRELRDELARQGDGPPPRCLSMGMSNDYTVAVEEGATHLRIGTALVGPP